MQRLTDSKKTLSILGAGLLLVTVSSTALARFEPGDDRLSPPIERRDQRLVTPTMVSPLPTPTAQATPKPQHEVEFTGVIESMAGDTWVVGGRSVAVTAATELKAGLEIGVLAKVHAITQADGSLQAREIEPARVAGDDDVNDDHGNNDANPNDDHGHDQGNGDVNSNNQGHDRGNNNENNKDKHGSDSGNAQVNSNDSHGHDDASGNVNQNEPQPNDDRGGHGHDDQGGHANDNPTNRGGDSRNHS